MWQERMRVAQSAARQAAAAIADRDAIAVEHKAENDFVTQMDRLSERIIMQRLTDAFPEDGFFGEEGGMRDQRQHEGCWIIDPIDGTTNYIQGIPTYTISIGYQYRGELTLGVVYCPGLDEMYTAVKGEGAYCNGEPIHVSRQTRMRESISSFSFAHRDPALREAMFTLLPALVASVSDLRRMGSAALDVCFVACGRFEAFLELALHLYDFAAARVILEEAGGRMTGWPGEGDCNQTGNVLCTNGILHEDFERVIREHFVAPET
ncbi:MAG: inositol monophosphatase family protein [Christensenellales bacterium]|jgi:myo-inositol-1(or 4)-monophosphatase